MSEQNSQPSQTTESGAKPEALNAGRRKLVRAGLAAAPVVAAFKSNMVLAAPGSGGQGTTVRASSFASFKENGALTCSAAPPNSLGRYLTFSQCKSDLRCGNMRFTSTSGKMKGCGFQKNVVSSLDNMSLQQVFNLKPARFDQRKLAQFCTAAYMSADTYGSASFMTKAQALDIWKRKGAWSPSPGVQWSLQDTVQYFERVYETQFDACFTEGQFVQADDIKQGPESSDQRLS